MRILYHGSMTQEHGLGWVVGYDSHPLYRGHWTLQMDTGRVLVYARRESFTILEDDNDGISNIGENSSHRG